MGGDFSIVGRVKLAFSVMSRWETLVTLGVFIVFWLLISYVADPWRRDSNRSSARLSRPARKPKPKVEEAAETIDEDDELPD